MEAGTSGANGPSAAASVRGSGVGNATHPCRDTEARCATETARTRRTAQMDCVSRVRPFTLPPLAPSSLSESSCHYHHHIYAHCLTASYHEHVGIGGVCRRCPAHDNVTALPPVCCSPDMLNVTQKLTGGRKGQRSLGCLE